jgi:Reverse transcriptase (RNA-dependent DNA polymerase)
MSTTPCSLRSTIPMSLISDYVDDIIVIENNDESILHIKIQLKDKFYIKDFDHLKYFLRIEISYSHVNLFLSQRKYILDLLKKIKKLDCMPSSTPINSKKN